MPTPAASRLKVILVSLGCGLLCVPAFGGSQARIVRLSDVQGSVRIDKNTGLGFEKAFLNLPVTQGMMIETGETGRAEIEFEDGSSMRLTPDTRVDFSTLGVADSGARVSEVNLTEGLAYVDWMAKRGDRFSLDFAREKLTLDRPAHFRVDASPTIANLAVFKGDVSVEGPAGALTVEKKKTATFNVEQNDKYTVENKVSDDALDSWDKEASAYHDQYAKNDGNLNSPYGYGVSDLNYYGGYTMVPGFGYMWQPYFAGVGWDPFMDGVWGFYPGYGYMFASPYPWGWLPYRYGNWNYIPAYGWMWQPGGWNNWVAVPRYTETAGVHVTALVPPAAGTLKTVTVGRAANLPSSALTSRLTLRSGSAGFGIARGSVENLSHLNRQVAKSGSVLVHAAPQFAASSPYRGGEWGSSSPGSAGSSAGHGASMGSGGHSSGGGGSHK